MVKRWIHRLFFLGLIAALAGAMAIYWLYHHYPNTQLEIQQPSLFEIEKGESLGTVARKLERDGIIPYSILLRGYGRLSGLASGLQAGEYTLQPGISIAELLDIFIEGRVNQYSVTLVEGLTVAEMLTDLREHPKLEQSLQNATTATLLSALEADTERSMAEGLFFADTYYFHAGDTDRSILLRALQRTEDVLAEEWTRRQEGLPYKTPYEALVMASIIEKETGAAYERPEIAGVFVRRLQKRMRLQSDPTVIYGLGDSYDGNIHRRDLRQATPYNTYVIRALPPTPIALVGREAIHAALNPSPGSSLYFVARGDGSHQFSDTLEEHNRAVRRYQLKRRADYRSSPPPEAADD
ncbi:endolytic transglycosylase MltG [Endozoicomonadaceae bacterium StTr2]